MTERTSYEFTRYYTAPMFGPHGDDALKNFRPSGATDGYLHPDVIRRLVDVIPDVAPDRMIVVRTIVEIVPIGEA